MLRAERDRPEAAVQVTRVADASLPTRHGDFRVLAFAVDGDPDEVIALVAGKPGEADAPLVRLHSECFTGDALGSLRCDCGEQLDASLRSIVDSGSGVLLYLRQEGRGIGLVNKLRAYELQDRGADTVDANKLLGLPVDGRKYASAAAVLRQLGLTRIRLLTNNPAKRRALQRAGIAVVQRVPLEVVANAANTGYLHVKAVLMGHELAGQRVRDRSPAAPARSDALAASAAGTPRAASTPSPAGSAAATQRSRPSVTVHYAQTLDGRIATRTGDSQWISGPESLRFAHELRASHDAIMVGVGTVLADDPRLTVRHVEGPSPLRVVVDSALRLPLDANVLSDAAPRTIVGTTRRAPEERIRNVERLGAEVLLVDEDEDGRVDLLELLRGLGERGVGSLLIEGGSGIITSALRLRVVDRLAVTIAPKLLGQGIEAVGDLNILRLREAIQCRTAEFTQVGDDIVFDARLT